MIGERLTTTESDAPVRLRDDQTPASVAAARAAHLLRACDPDVSDLESAAQERRVYARLARRSNGGWRPAPGFWLRPMPVLALLLAGRAVAGVTVGRDWSARVLGSLRRPATRSAAKPAVAPVVDIVAAPRIEAPAVAAPPGPLERVPSGRPARKVARNQPEATAPAAATERQEAALVMQAVRALRQDKDNARAVRLLATYLEQFPRGALAEEALALGIEATQGRHPDEARDWATRYLARFPGGRFAAVARDAARAHTP